MLAAELCKTPNFSKRFKVFKSRPQNVAKLELGCREYAASGPGIQTLS